MCRRCRARAERERHPLSESYRVLKKDAARRGIPFELSRDEYAAWATGTGYAARRGRSKTCWHIDRIDATGPYALWNIRPLTATENGRKGATLDKAAHSTLRRTYDPDARKMLFWFNHWRPDPDAEPLPF